MYYTKRCISSSVISMIVVWSSYFMNISFQFYHQHYRTSSTMLSCTICSFPGTNKITRYFQHHSLFSKHHNRLRILFWQQAVHSNYHYSLLNKPQDISNQEFIFDTLTTSIQYSMLPNIRTLQFNIAITSLCKSQEL